MASNLDFLNKNLFRKYPLTYTSSLVSTNGLDLPQDLIASVSISTTIARSNLYISQVVLNNGFIAITVEHYDTDPSNTIAIGCFAGTITQDFQTLNLTPFVPFASGSLIAGSARNIKNYVRFMTFNFDDANLEPTTAFCYTPPAVTSLRNRNSVIQGRATFGTLINLTKTLTAFPDNFFQFAVIDTGTIESLADFSSEFRNCPTPVITSINNSVPYTPNSTPEGNDNNIYIFGVEPITFEPVQLTTSPDTYGINITTPGLDLPTMCSNAPLLPPVAPNFVVNRAADSFVGISRYYSKSQTPIVNFLTTTLPEYTLWPNFVLTYTTALTNPTNGTGTVIFDATTPILNSGQSATIKEVAMQTSTGTVNVAFNLLNSSTTTNIIPSSPVTAEGTVILPTVDSTFVPTTKFTVDISGVSGAMVLSFIVFYNLVTT